MKSFENGLPIDGDTTHALSQSGKVSKRQSLTYAFDNTSGTRTLQDVGLDGLTNDEEYGFSSYKDYLAKLEAKLSPAVVEEMRQDQFSPFNDPAGDNYHFYRGHDYDDAQTSILDRYKHYNGTEGNSLSTEDVADSYYQSSKSVPDVEDINQDNTLNEYERYYQYRISLCPDSLVVGKNYITDKRETTVPLRNGQEGKAVWYQFKVPLSQPQKKVGSIQDFKTIRFIRMFMTGFEVETHLRFATLELVRGEWRTYDYAVDKATNSPAQGNLDVSVVNIEENAGQEPVNYVLPPGVTRIIDPGQSQITQLNEQAMSLKVTDLPTGEGRAVYKTAAWTCVPTSGCRCLSTPRNSSTTTPTCAMATCRYSCGWVPTTNRTITNTRYRSRSPSPVHTAPTIRRTRRLFGPRPTCSTFRFRSSPT